MFPLILRKSLLVWVPLAWGDVGHNAVGLYSLGNYDTNSSYCIFVDYCAFLAIYSVVISVLGTHLSQDF